MLDVVKNTLVTGITDMFCPNYCISCGRIGRVLCECCKNYNTLGGVGGNATVEIFEFETVVSGKFVGFVDDRLGEMVKMYKFKGKRDLSLPLASILYSGLSDFWRWVSLISSGNVVIVPCPTASRHIRTRGFDHILELSKDLARVGGFRVDSRFVLRGKDTVQVGAREIARKRQVREAYELGGSASRRIDPVATYVVVDDVFTTGSTVRRVSELLLSAGVAPGRVWFCTLVRNR